MRASGQRSWGSSPQRRQDIVDAAAAVFEDEGYRTASIGDVAARSGTSTGSLYHHFDGKAGLFVAAWESRQDAYETDVAAVVRRAHSDGQRDAFALLEIGTRAYLRTVWAHRRIEAVYRGADAPSELAQAQRSRTQRWISRNAALLGGVGPSITDLRVAILTAAIGEVADRVVACSSDADAEALIAEAAPILVSIVRD